MSGEELRAAAQAVVDAAETDDDFDGQFIDWMVPDEKITALRAALAAPSTPEPSGHPTDAFVQQAMRFIAEHEATHGEPEQCGGECIVLGLTDDEAAPSTEPGLDAALLDRAIVMTLPFEKWISPETAASIAAEYARLAESQP